MRVLNIASSYHMMSNKKKEKDTDSQRKGRIEEWKNGIKNKEIYQTTDSCKTKMIFYFNFFILVFASEGKYKN